MLTYGALLIHDGKNPQTLVDESESVASLWIADESARALVALDLCWVLLTMDEKSASHILLDPDARQRAFLREHQQAPTGLLFNKNLSYQEGVLEAGEKVVVFGLCRLEPDPEPPPGGVHGYRDVPLRRRIVAPPGGETLITDDPAMLRIR